MTAPRWLVHARAELECPVCFDVTPTLTIALPCAHSLCWTCINRVSTCPTCRCSIEFKKPNYVGNKLAQLVLDEQNKLNLRTFQDDLELFSPCLKDNPPPVHTPRLSQADRALKTLRKSLREAVFDAQHVNEVHRLIDAQGLPTQYRAQLKIEATELAEFRSR